jgi:large subunit ribosomal protein L1
MQHGKKYRAAAELAGKAGQIRNLAEAVKLVKQTARAKFDETIVVSSHLGVDPRHSDQLVRGTVVLPHGTGKSLRVLVLARGEKVKEAEAAGADFAGAEEFVKKIQDGWLDIDAIVATPDLMGEVGKLGRVLGPRGLMPNPKSGTVTFDVAKAVKELKAGKIEFRVDKGSNVHARSARPRSARRSCSGHGHVPARAGAGRPAATKGTYIKSLTLSATMGPGITLDPAAVTAELAH